MISSIKKFIANRKMINFYSQFIRKGDLCFDIGGNIGARTNLFLALGAKVVCVEPQSSCIAILKQRFADNPNVIVVGKALGEKEGSGILSICNTAPTISTMSDDWKDIGRFSANYNWSNKEEVSLLTLDNLISTYGRPQFCKIDVEGYEKHVIKGLTQRIPYISYEFTREFLVDAGTCADQLLSISKNEFNYSLGELPELSLPQWVSSPVLFEHLSKIDDKDFWGDIYACSNHSD